MRNPIWILTLCAAACGPSTGAVVSDAGTGGGSTGGSTPTSCTIATVDYAAGAANPADGCQLCQPAVTATGWSSKSCPAAEICASGTCITPSGGCTIGIAGQDGGTYAAGTANPSNPCQSCNPTTSATAWTNAADSTACGTDKICTQGSCQAGCYTGGAFYVATEPNPTDSCQNCQPATSTSSWTADTGLAPAGGSCDAGQVCNMGACATGCYIASAFVTPGALDPADACETCQPGASSSSWSPFTGPAPDGGCPAGEVCNNGSCCAPTCAGRCPFAADGCGGQCPVPTGPYPGCTYDGGVEGCCDGTGVCQPGDTTADCTVGAACQSCTVTSNTCNEGPAGYSCCTPGQGCGVTCGDAGIVDQCGNSCPFSCPTTSCCDANLNCQPGTTATACGKGGTLGSCNDCGAFSCDTTTQGCGFCHDGDTKPDPACAGCTSALWTCANGNFTGGTCQTGCLGGMVCTAGHCT
jgi:hypothetical protein